MKPGDKNIQILDTIMKSKGIQEANHLTTISNGLFYIKELESSMFNSIPKNILRDIPKEYRNKAIDTMACRYPEILDKEIQVPISFSEDLRYDFTIFKIENNEVVFYKTFEMQGEGHFIPIFGLKAYIKTILSDIIKESFGTIMIPLMNGYKKEEILSSYIDSVLK